MRFYLQFFLLAAAVVCCTYTTHTHTYTFLRHTGAHTPTRCHRNERDSDTAGWRWVHECDGDGTSETPTRRVSESARDDSLLRLGIMPDFLHWMRWLWLFNYAIFLGTLQIGGT